ncbi:hypothetical protein UNDKW_2290 [Undibacterium sp. KW1]|nr:hypothetical protein UNDKW_2290 [Undibacterium sp. KW1]
MRLGIGVFVHEAAEVSQGCLAVTGLPFVIGLDYSVHDLVEFRLAALVVGNGLAMACQYFCG